MRYLCLLSGLLLLLSTAGCSMLAEHGDETAGWDAAQFYREAKALLDRGDYQGALELYSKMEARHPYGPYTQQAQLETGYAHYKLDEPEAAITAADHFIKLHPRHPQVDYAYYLRGLASFDHDLGFLDKFISLDTSKRDPETARESFRYFKELVSRFPDSKYTEDALQRMTHLRNRLARYEIHVADYYLRRKAYLAAANRAKYVLENYARTPAVADALGILVQAYDEMEMDELASNALRLLRLNYPEHPALRRATIHRGTSNTE